jgi:hypothetical protein
VSQDRYPIFLASLLAVTLVASATLLHADNPASSSDGTRTVQVNVGGKMVPIKVRDSHDPFRNVSDSGSTGKYDPEHVFSSTNEMANKKFSTDTDTLTKTDSSSHSVFVTKAYTDNGSLTAPNLNSKADVHQSTFGKTADGFDKNYFTTTDSDQSHHAVLASATTSPDQNHTAVLGGPDKQEALAADPFANKQYLGPGAQKVPDTFAKGNVVLAHLNDLPNRPLSIDEVRNLINHATKPDFNAKPEESSKPLNDPNYKPEPLRDDPAPSSSSSSPASDDDKNDSVPPPGTMAHPPENSESLPQP